ncbi:MAG: glucose-1-phosphate cytidylyltransferase [Candidatus Scalindua sp. AMX11]|nr:MAG: glucose-1-phosphate cytidylyltransferase [Candidatus Scalindua sp.]NOG82535.1 glucose-1-phosphate cytidylyltransferase [Planctomycetota bacterium]RZV93965.1 MAG: glucose-1-phosphate cytidylyltransferase [Candidatus Scalindua sp. SCAELEC01]TDE63992.1 MAG: glucose-1-phosphate cytidylyltransferase [Candidatus Scalindua sp. AMX11]GJQ58171.1 MAG: glucose-1-phosphate cytidylyltransferase [Candidatus Scalindua sp.]
MKAVILAGGYGTRLSEETAVRPKPMVEIGGKPILWHIMKTYSSYGIDDFIICLGYKGYYIKEYFSTYSLHMTDVTFDMKNNKTEIHQNGTEEWRVTLIDTGEKTMTGGRLKRVRDYIGDESFCFTYGDGVCDVNIMELIRFHKEQKTLATVTAVQPPERFGVLSINDNLNKIVSFKEKPQGEGTWVNGGFFVLEPEVIDYIADDMTVWEHEPLQELAQEGMLSAFKHNGFWQPMDTLRDKVCLGELWDAGKAPWKVWQ